MPNEQIDRLQLQVTCRILRCSEDLTKTWSSKNGTRSHHKPCQLPDFVAKQQKVTKAFYCNNVEAVRKIVHNSILAINVPVLM